MRAAVLIALLLGGCIDAAQEVEAFPAGGREGFIAQAQPVLGARCANPSCHGNASRPLSIYAVQRHRKNPDHVFLDAPLAEEELTHNFFQASAFLLGISHADESRLLSKPLAGHAGVAVFSDKADHDYQRLRAWIEAALADGATP